MRKESPSSSKLSSPTASELIEMFAERNPTTSRAQVEAIGRLVAEFGAVAAEFAPVRLQRFGGRNRLRMLIKEIVSETKTTTEQQNLMPKVVEIVQGASLGDVLSETEGRARLKAFATPVTAESWARPLAGATELERDFDIARSTLHTWQKKGAVIAVLVGVRKHAFPVEQFVDNRPVTGLAQLVTIIGDARTAWLWLREPNPGLSGATPLSHLKAGALETVFEIARSNFKRD
jgi:hypothetical protein